ncbi:uncharacterized protein [Triticum aestivum]|uniref:uncharacterized protein n=1 Tax=Triticum aestivum TaxID=4565 RepID=UPI001D02D6D3|nr:uncharacterized protein LOC123156967 [Triticum aestivum]
MAMAIESKKCPRNFSTYASVEGGAACAMIETGDTYSGSEVEQVRPVLGLCTKEEDGEKKMKGDLLVSLSASSMRFLKVGCNEGWGEVDTDGKVVIKKPDCEPCSTEDDAVSGSPKGAWYASEDEVDSIWSKKIKT